MLIEQVIEFELRRPGPSGHRRSQEIRGSPRIEMLSMAKMWQKSLLFFQF